MRVFVTGTGRCCSVTFRMACTHMTNYGNGHETLNGLLEYPENFIEVNPQIRNCIESIVHKYPTALWVHLVRPPAECIPSLARLNHGEVMEYYRKLYGAGCPTYAPMDVAYRYYWAENNRITTALRLHVPENKRIVFHTEHAKEQFSVFWQRINAQGDRAKAIAEWDTKYNSGEDRGETCPEQE